MNILFTCAGRRNYLINYFKEALKGNGLVYASDMQANAPAMVDADVAVVAPSIYDKNYIEFLKNVVLQNKIKAIISLNDLELPMLAKHKNDFLKYNCNVLVSSPKVIDLSFDKLKTFHFLKSIGIKTPQTYISLEQALTSLKSGELHFPVVLKPRWGSASIAIRVLESFEDLIAYYEIQKSNLKKTILKNVSQDLDASILIQEYIAGDEYGVDVLNDFQGNYISSYARKKLAMRAGETDKATSVIDSKISKTGKIIGENLKHIGNLDVDMFHTKEGYSVLELNPRFGGGYPFSHEAGINTAAIYIAWLQGETDISKHDHYTQNLTFSKCDRLIRV